MSKDKKHLTWSEKSEVKRREAMPSAPAAPKNDQQVTPTLEDRVKHLENAWGRHWMKLQKKKTKKRQKKEKKALKQARELTLEQEMFDAICYMLNAFDIGQQVSTDSAIHKARKARKRGHLAGL